MRRYFFSDDNQLGHIFHSFKFDSLHLKNFPILSLTYILSWMNSKKSVPQSIYPTLNFFSLTQNNKDSKFLISQLNEFCLSATMPFQSADSAPLLVILAPYLILIHKSYQLLVQILSLSYPRNPFYIRHLLHLSTCSYNLALANSLVSSQQT